MNKIEVAFKRFDSWMKKYNHGTSTDQESFVNFIIYDTWITNNYFSYHDYQKLFELASAKEYKINKIISVDIYNKLILGYILDLNRVMLDPSLLVRKTKHEAIKCLIDTEKSPHEIYLPNSFLNALKNKADVGASWWRFYQGNAKPSDIDSLRETINSFNFHSFSYKHVIDDDSAQVLIRIEDFVKDPTLAEILFDEWIYLQKKSILGSASRRTFDIFKKAGAGVIEFGNKSFDKSVIHTLKDSNISSPIDLTHTKRMRACMKWIAVGGPAVLTLINPLATAVGSIASGYFLLIDP